MGARASLLVMIGTALMAGSTAASAQDSTKHRAARPAPPAHATADKTAPKDKVVPNDKIGPKDVAAPNKPAKPMTRREEIEHAIDTRSVPERYRSSVPKEYQKYIPFAKDR